MARAFPPLFMPSSARVATFAHPAAADRPGLGIAMVLLAVLGFSLLDGTVKFLSAVVPLLIVVWVRYAVQAGVMGGWLAATGGGASFRVAHPRFQLLRGALLLMTSVLAYLGLQAMPVAEFTAITLLAPVMVTLLSPLLLRERVTALRWLLVLVAFAGALIVIRPGSGLFGPAALYPLALAAAGAFFQILTRRMASLEPPLTTHFCTGLVGMLLLTLVLPLSPTPLAPVVAELTALHWLLMLLAGLLGTVAHLAFIRAVSVAPMAVLMPFTYAQIAFAAALGALLFAHLPDGWAMLGMGIIAFSGAVSVWVNVTTGKPAVMAVDTTMGD